METLKTAIQIALLLAAAAGIANAGGHRPLGPELRLPSPAVVAATIRQHG